MDRPDECPDQSGNGGGCESLQRYVVEGDRLRKRVGAVEVGLATMRIAVDATREDAHAVRSVVCGPANEALARYQSDRPPPDLLDADDGEDIPTSDAIHVPWMAARKVQHEKRRAADAEQARIRLEAEKLVAERHAADLAEAKARDDKRHTRNMAILAAVAALGTAGGTLFALLSKAIH